MRKLKAIIKKIIGNRAIEKLKQFYKVFFVFLYSCEKIKYDERYVDFIEEIFISKMNVFTGYYDIDPIKDGKLLLHSLDKSKKDIELGYYDLNTKKIHFFAKTKAWSWQQGSRLRWSREHRNEVYFNSINKNKNYCTYLFDIEKKEIIKEYELPFYDISNSEKYAVSINFSRLQRLRPGYGYSCFEDETKLDFAAKDDGIFLVNLKENTTKMIISLYDLAQKNDPDLKCEHYINHLAFSPNSKKLMFFHLWDEPLKGRNTELCIIDVNTNELKVLEEEFLVSHYAWVNDEELLITAINRKTRDCGYYIYNINGKKEKLYREKVYIRRWTSIIYARSKFYF